MHACCTVYMHACTTCLHACMHACLQNLFFRLDITAQWRERERERERCYLREMLSIHNLKENKRKHLFAIRNKTCVYNLKENIHNLTDNISLQFKTKCSFTTQTKHLFVRHKKTTQTTQNRNGDYDCNGGTKCQYWIKNHGRIIIIVILQHIFHS